MDPSRPALSTLAPPQPVGRDLDVLARRLETLGDERDPESPMSPKELARYAHGVVSATGVQPGEALTVALSGVEDMELTLEVAVNAYLRGARLVRIVSDDYLLPALVRELRQAGPDKTPVIASANDELVWQEMTDDDSSYLMVNEWRDDPQGLVDQGERANSLRWCLAYWPSPTLARAQGLSERELAERLLDFTRNGPTDPLDAYDRHLATLHARARALNQLDLAEIAIATPDGSDLSVGLLADSLFQVCDWETTRGKRFSCNFPTEEIFFTPDPRQTRGRIRSVAPVEIGPFALQSVTAEFAAGALVPGTLKVVPQDPSTDSAALAAELYHYLATHPGALRLGEAALIGRDSRIGSEAERYGINNIDENAGVHVALGDSYLAGLAGLDHDGSERNVCLDSDGYSLHFDLTLSWGQADVRGVTAEGQTVALMENGDWQVGGSGRIEPVSEVNKEAGPGWET
jgi:leucyl aminopeptidase (aminopeptidase T)